MKQFAPAIWNRPAMMQLLPDLRRTNWLSDFKDVLFIGAIASASYTVVHAFIFLNSITATNNAHQTFFYEDLSAVLISVIFTSAFCEFRRRQYVTREINARLAAEKTATDHLRLADSAINNLSQGVCMFDASAHIVLCNDRYRQIWGLSADIVKPGNTLRDVLEHQKEMNNFHQNIDEYVSGLHQQLATGKSIEHLVRLKDGRSIRLIQRPLPHGGWVATHEDVTAQRNAELERDVSRKFLNTVIDNVPATILVKDARDFRYVLLNRAGHEFFGLPSESILGKTAHEFFPKEVAEAITARDMDLLQKGHQRFEEDRPIHAASKEVRHVASERLVIHGPDGKPQYLLGVVVDVTERRQAEAQIAYMARHDALTGLANRPHFLNRVHQHLEQTARDGSQFNILMIDLDGFKAVNDSLGHAAGDALLRIVARRISDCVREVDLVARLGGDEFVILQTVEDEQTPHADDLAKRLLRVIGDPYDLDGNQALIGASIGIALAPTDGNTAGELLKKADLALYKAKSKGRDGYRFFEAEMEAEAHARHVLQNDLYNALRRNEFEVHYQTVFDARTRRVCGAEALVRWQHPERGLVSPGEFIPLAEETGLIVPLGEWILRRACLDAAGWPPDVKLAVNLSPAQFKNRNLLDVVATVLAETGLAPERLELEITETVLLQKDADNLVILDRLKRLGIAIVLDDFGTGYSSLSYIRMFPFDKIKIDRSFVSELLNRADCAAIVSAVVGLGRSLDILTTAEGVETEEQFSLLRAAGVNQIQGYLFSRPVPISALKFQSAKRDATRDVRSRAS